MVLNCAVDPSRKFRVSSRRPAAKSKSSSEGQFSIPVLLRAPKRVQSVWMIKVADMENEKEWPWRPRTELKNIECEK